MSKSVQLADTFSNVAFLIAGAACFLEFSERPYAEAMGAALIFVGLWSAAFHGSKGREAQSLDEIGMYGVLSVLLFAALAAWLGLGEAPLVHIIMVGSWLLLAAFHRVIDSHVFVPALMAVAFLLILVTGGTVLALLGATLAVLAWSVNQYGGYGHAIWHVLIAAAALSAFAAI